MEMLEMMLHSKKLNYERLNKILPKYIPKQTSEYDTVNIIVDLYDVVKQLYKPQLIEQIHHMKVSERWQICSEIINICGHYRNYFATRLWKYTNFYFIYSDDISIYHKFAYPEYKLNFYSKRLDLQNESFGLLSKIIKENFKLIKTFLEYIPHAYMINSKEVDHTLVPYILLNEEIIDNTIPTLLISNEEIYFQDFAYNDYLMQLLIKGDKSRIVTKENMWEEVTSSLKKKPDIHLIPELYPVVLACTGYKNFDIDSVNRMGIARAIPFVTKELLDKGYIQNIDYNSIDVFANSIKNSSIKEEFKQPIIQNFKLLSHSATSNIAYSQKNVEDIKIQCEIDRIDSKALKFINEKYFEKFPILMDFLMIGESYDE